MHYAFCDDNFLHQKYNRMWNTINKKNSLHFCGIKSFVLRIHISWISLVTSYFFFFSFVIHKREQNKMKISINTGSCKSISNKFGNIFNKMCSAFILFYFHFIIEMSCKNGHFYSLRFAFHLCFISNSITNSHARF